jgi:hypothetical protein
MRHDIIQQDGNVHMEYNIHMYISGYILCIEFARGLHMSILMSINTISSLLRLLVKALKRSQQNHRIPILLQDITQHNPLTIEQI